MTSVPRLWLAHQRVLLFLILVPLIVSGCRAPAEMLWSPSGSEAAYRSDGHTILLNPEGAITADLAGPISGFAWSADSRQLFFATSAKDDGTATPSAVDLGWLKYNSDSLCPPTGLSELETAMAPVPPVLPATQPTTESARSFWDTTRAEHSIVTVHVRQDGHATELLRLRSHFNIVRMFSSPDGKWLAIGTQLTDMPLLAPFIPMVDLYVYSLRSGKLYGVTAWCSDACFSGPDQRLTSADRMS